jgi:hypothetical protein
MSVKVTGIRGPFWTIQATAPRLGGVDAAWATVTFAAEQIACLAISPTKLDGGGWRVKVYLVGGPTFTDRELYTEDQAREIRDAWIKSRAVDGEPPGPVGCAPDCPVCERERAKMRDVRDVVAPGDIAETAPTRDAGLRNPIVDAPLPLEQALRNVLNGRAELGSDTPDFVLAEFLGRVLQAFDRAVRARSAYWDGYRGGAPKTPPPINPGRVMPTVSAEVYDAVTELLTYTGQTGASGPTMGGTHLRIARLRTAFEANEQWRDAKWRAGGPDGV